MLVANAFTQSTGAYRGSNSYIIYTSGGSSSTSALALAKIVGFGANGSSAVTITAGASNYYGAANYTSYISVGAPSTAFKTEYTMYPLLTPLDSFLF